MYGLGYYSQLQIIGSSGSLDKIKTNSGKTGDTLRYRAEINQLDNARFASAILDANLNWAQFQRTARQQYA